MKFPEQTKQYELQLDAGQYMTKLRVSANVTLTSAAKSIGISTVYLSEIEKGLKVPSDLLIRSISDFYDINEDQLFKRFGKIPLFAREELESFDNLQCILADIRRKKIPDEHKHRLYDSMIKLYKEFLESIDQPKIGKRGDNSV